MTQYEIHLRDQLLALQMEYHERAKPIIDKLVRLEMLKTPKPIFISKTDLSQDVLEQLRQWSSTNTPGAKQ